MNANCSRIALIALGVALALPAAARQGGMHDMQTPARSSTTPASASSAQSMQGMDMQDMHMGSMHGMPASRPTPMKSRKPRSAKPASASSAESVHGMGMSSVPAAAMPQHPAMQHGTVPTASESMPPSQPVATQQLHFGQMIGTRPRPGGLAQGMGMPSMQHADMPSMQGGKAPPGARSADYSDGYRYTDMPGMEMFDHASFGMLLIDQLEYAFDNHGNDAAMLDGQFWYGADFNKLWLKFEGESARGKLEDLRTEALWDHAASTYWSTQLGVRHDFGEGPGRSWAAFGVQGLAPYWFETEATFYLGQNGRTAARVEVEYEELLTQRLVLQPRLELNLYGKDDPQRGIGSGLSDVALGIRLRYEIRREFAPYVGVIWRQRHGRSADFARAQGEPASDMQFVAGLRFWF
ncbi:MAG TPA: copper resistance protein B [Rhodanobacteraceae bacterium]|nr:copper resistance protein B [Rhodanobacteraceae bacterium]